MKNKKNTKKSTKSAKSVESTASVRDFAKMPDMKSIDWRWMMAGAGAIAGVLLWRRRGIFTTRMSTALDTLNEKVVEPAKRRARRATGSKVREDQALTH